MVESAEFFVTLRKEIRIAKYVDEYIFEQILIVITSIYAFK